MILFKKIRYQNLLSTGNQFTEILLNRSKSTLVVGENGAGKSTFIEAITFALYGKPFRNINKPQLINAITGKGLLVEIEFDIGNKEYMVRRGIKPTVFEIYLKGELVNQNADAREYQEYLEKHILKLNFKSFSQIVVLGSANYIPFMQLAANQRRGVVEDLLDIQIFSVMNSILKDKMLDNRSQLSDTESNIRLCEQKIALHTQHIDALKSNNDDIVAQKNAKIAEYRIDFEQLSAATEDLLERVREQSAHVADQSKAHSRNTKLIQLEGQLEDRVSKLKREILFYHNHDDCPTCKQEITVEFKQVKIEDRHSKEAAVNTALVKIEEEIAKNSARLEFINTTNQEISKLNNMISTNNQQITFLNSYIVDITKEIESLHVQSKKITGDADQTKSYNKELSMMNDQREKLINQKVIIDISSVLLKDTGIKTRIIRQYVPVMNKLINKYLASMDFFVNFELDESFNETIKSRFRDDFSYASFSEGEKMRIDLALMFTWRAIAKLRNSASTNILIMDEVFDSSLDASGTEEFLKILESLTQDTNTFVISHKGDQLFDRFHSVIKFEKHANFSRMVV